MRVPILIIASKDPRRIYSIRFKEGANTDCSKGNEREL